MSENAMITEAAVDSKVATSSEGGKPSFVECHVSQQQGKIYVRDYAGAGPAFVLMHGFPDNSRIYDDLIPYLVAADRRVVAFDFLGFGNARMRRLETILGYNCVSHPTDADWHRSVTAGDRA